MVFHCYGPDPAALRKKKLLSLLVQYMNGMSKVAMELSCKLQSEFHFCMNLVYGLKEATPFQLWLPKLPYGVKHSHLSYGVFVTITL